MERAAKGHGDPELALRWLKANDDHIEAIRRGDVDVGPLEDERSTAATRTTQATIPAQELQIKRLRKILSWQRCSINGLEAFHHGFGRQRVASGCHKHNMRQIKAIEKGEHDESDLEIGSEGDD